MEKENIFLYEKNKLKEVIELINKQIKEAEENFSKQEHTIIGFKEGQRGTQFIRQGLMSLYATEIYNLKSVLSNPYFGMFNFENSEEKNEIYLGKKTIMDGTKVIAHDWRSPICSMYYDYNIGDAEYISNTGEKRKGQITTKRQIIIKDGILKDVDDQDTLSNDAVLLKYLKENSDARLKSIIATIQREQNKIIRSPLREDYIIQGTAGSGKTTVALHRIAYLLYNEAKNISEADFMILGPNKYFLNYISDLLPDLDIKNISQLTFEEIAMKYMGISKVKLESKNKTLQEVLAGNVEGKVISDKSSIEFLRLIEKFVDFYVQSHLKDDIEYEGLKICPVEDMKSYFNKEVFSIEKGYSERANQYIKILIKKIKDNSDDLAHNIWLRYRDEYLDLPKDSPRRKEILDEVDKIQMEIKKGCPTSIKNYFKFMKVNPLALYQSFIENLNIFTQNDQNCLKELQDYTLSRLSKKQIGFEDLSPLLLINYSLNGVKDFKDFSYLVIDEAQDLSLAQYYVLKKLFPSAKFNVFGDVNQSVYDYQSIHDWDELNKVIFNNKANMLDLNKSYRTTVNISNASNLILSHLGQNNSECVARPGNEIIVSNDITDNNLISQIKTLLDKEYHSVAIICKDEKETNMVYKKLSKLGLNVSVITEKNEEYHGGLCIMPSYLSKGLEFDAVILYNANNINYTDSYIDSKLLYVAMTRAMHELYVNYNGELPIALKSLSKNEKILKRTK
ncbi:MAG: HelD family protein [Bacilli bacterium]